VDPNHLIMMANDIGAYFAGYPDHEYAVEGIANHLRNFWHPRMRREIIQYASLGGDELEPLVLEAVLALSREAPADSEDVCEG
jgi:formate dehydrogenase subunit delta